VADLTRAIELDPELAWAIAARGETYRLMDRYEDAVADLTRAIELSPDDAEVIGTRGQAYQAMGRHEDAVADLTRAIELDPELAWAIAARGETYRLMDRYKDALADLTQAIGIEPEYAWALGTRGQVYRAVGRYEDALADLTRAIEVDPELAWAIAERSKVHLLMGRHDAAADLIRPMGLDPMSAPHQAARNETHRPTMFDMFTPSAKNALVMAQEEARFLLQHDYIGPEHLLLGLIRDSEGIAGTALECLGINLETARQRVKDICGIGGHEVVGHIAFTRDTKRALESSLAEARRLGHDFIGTGHILLSLILDGEGSAAQLLEEMGANLLAIQARVDEELKKTIRT
jgi:tetratricopeptide (TPR) repeat protein